MHRTQLYDLTLRGILLIILVWSSSAKMVLPDSLDHLQDLYHSVISNSVAASGLGQRWLGSNEITAYFMTLDTNTGPTFYEYENPAQFQSLTGYNGTQNIVFTINDFFADFLTLEILSALIHARTSVFLFVRWSGDPVPPPLPAFLNNREFPGNYSCRAEQAAPIARYITNIITDIQSQGVNLPANKIEFLTSGIGSHAAGMVGEVFPGILRIFAYEPAGPLFVDKPLAERLDKEDAQRVIVVHFNSDEYGIENSVGDVDFYILTDVPYERMSYGSRYFSSFLQKSNIGGTTTVPTAKTQHISRIPRQLGNNFVIFPFIENIKAFITVLLPEAYSCSLPGKFMVGNCISNHFAPLPLFGIDDDSAVGNYYHAFVSLPDSNFIYPSPVNPDHLVKSPSTPIKMVIRTNSPRNEGLIEARTLITDPFGDQSFATEYQTLLDSEYGAPGFSQTFFTVPYGFTFIHGANVTFSLRFRNKLLFDSDFSIREVNVFYRDRHLSQDLNLILPTVQYRETVLRGCNIVLPASDTPFETQLNLIPQGPCGQTAA